MNRLTLTFAHIQILLILFAGFMTVAVRADDSPQIEFIGTASIAGDAPDLSGDAKLLENGEPRNRLGGFSALDYSGSGNQFAAMSDRGPDDGAVGYSCRVQTLAIDIQPKAKTPVSVKVVRTTLFTDKKGRPLTGLSSAIKTTKEISHRFDPEGFRYGPGGTMFVSDEYGPVLLQFADDGREQQRFKLPNHLLLENPSADRKIENESNSRGRASNRGMEGLAISSDGKCLVGIMQSPLLQDAEKDAAGLIRGRNCRIVQVDIETERIREFVYQMDSVDNGNSEILAYAANQFLVLERDSLAGDNAAYRKLIHVDVSKATDVADRSTLPAGELPPNLVQVTRRVYLDLLDPKWHLAGQSMPEKIEGLTFGPTLADGRQTLLVGSDNDFESANASLIWVFAVREAKYHRR